MGTNVFFFFFFSDCKFKVKKNTHNASLVKKRKKKKHISPIYGELSTFVKWPLGKFMCTEYEPKIKETFTSKKHFLTSEFFFGFFLIQPDENKV